MFYEIGCLLFIARIFFFAEEAGSAVAMFSVPSWMTQTWLGTLFVSALLSKIFLWHSIFFTCNGSHFFLCAIRDMTLTVCLELNHKSIFIPLFLVSCGCDLKQDYFSSKIKPDGPFEIFLLHLLQTFSRFNILMILKVILKTILNLHSIYRKFHS